MNPAACLHACRLVVLEAAHALDRVGNKAARGQIAAAKALAPSAVLAILDRAIQASKRAGTALCCAALCCAPKGGLTELGSLSSGFRARGEYFCWCRQPAS
jgi:alkylation response protein AidB-like acyl-CoA dehydrogenase